MSKTGKLTRGLKYWMQRDIEGNLPVGISEDPYKMEDVNFYLDFVKGKDQKETSKINEKIFVIRHLERSPKRNQKFISDTKKALIEGKDLSKEVQEKVKEDEKAKSKNSKIGGK